MTSRIPDPADPFEEEGLASQEPGLAGKRITGDPQDDMVVPRDTPVAVDDYGTTAAEEPHLLERAATTDADESEDSDQPYPVDPEEKVGRIVETDEGARTDDEASAVANDVGTDLGGFSAEERAMHIQREV